MNDKKFQKIENENRAFQAEVDLAQQAAALKAVVQKLKQEREAQEKSSELRRLRAREDHQKAQDSVNKVFGFAD